MAADSEALRDVAFYYPGHIWRAPEWIKMLLLFFDGIALLVPEYKQGEPEAMDPILAGPLRDRGLLHYLVADEVVDQKATGELETVMTGLIESGTLDRLARDGSAFHELSMSRMGYYGDRGLAEKIFEMLHARGLARKSEDGVSVPLHRAVRYLILVLLAQILRPRGSAYGLDLSPATDRAPVVGALTELLQLPTSPSAGSVITFDLQAVTVDLSAVPLDEVLDFRMRHRAAHRQYARAVRSFARELSLLPEAERSRAFSDRKEELDDLASGLRRNAGAAWKRRATFALGLAGATWTLKMGDPRGALISLGAALLSYEQLGQTEAGAFSYLFAANEKFV